MSHREAEALDHIKRNGSLLWMPCSSWEAAELWRRLKRDGKVKYNQWSRQWDVVAPQSTGQGDPNG